MVETGTSDLNRIISQLEQINSRLGDVHTEIALLNSALIRVNDALIKNDLEHKTILTAIYGSEGSVGLAHRIRTLEMGLNAIQKIGWTALGAAITTLVAVIITQVIK